jgi:autotransporter strand-loop-strand O-heptosyltransferase
VLNYQIDPVHLEAATSTLSDQLDSSVDTKSSAAPKTPYPSHAAVPTQIGPFGVRFDFNLGARVVLPEGDWRGVLRDLDTGNILFTADLKGGGFLSSKRYYVRFGIELWRGGEIIFRHDYDARDREVLVQYPIGTLGDILAWFPYAVRFQQLHGCRLTCAMSGLIIPLLRDAYPHIRFVTHEEFAEQNLAQTFYATYSMGLFFEDKDNIWQPTDFRHVGLHRTAGYILGVDPTEQAPLLALPDESRPIPERYICIAVQASTQAKKWNNPHGWAEVVRHLKDRGYRVICIDREATHGSGLVWTHLPHGAEDLTGDRPLTDRARWLRHASAFIGTSSGLAWLAWAAGCPTVLISGFTHPNNEFTTPGRVVNWHACNSCWNDARHRFDHKDFLWCPRHANTARQFECSRLITSAHVIATLGRIPNLS